MLELDGRTYTRKDSVKLSFSVPNTPGKRTATLNVSDATTGDGLQGNGMVFATVRSAQCWCINAGHLVDYVPKGGK